MCVGRGGEKESRKQRDTETEGERVRETETDRDTWGQKNRDRQ